MIPLFGNASNNSIIKVSNDDNANRIQSVFTYSKIIKLLIFSGNETKFVPGIKGDDGSFIPGQIINTPH